MKVTGRSVVFATVARIKPVKVRPFKISNYMSALRTNVIVVRIVNTCCDYIYTGVTEQLGALGHSLALDP